MVVVAQARTSKRAFAVWSSCGGAEWGCGWNWTTSLVASNHISVIRSS